MKDEYDELNEKLEKLGIDIVLDGGLVPVKFALTLAKIVTVLVDKIEIKKNQTGNKITKSCDGCCYVFSLSELYHEENLLSDEGRWYCYNCFKEELKRLLNMRLYGDS
jgi:hypothetical protein